tara:strand:+ start:16407 stop:18440 length:2034 start_codon:yes stop_codon:yes gene_type:complete
LSIRLADVEAPLALFTEGIAGRYLHLRSRDEFSLNPRLNIDLSTTAQTHDSVFLPEQLTTDHASAYRVLVMQQLGQRECGTFKFRLDEALRRVPALVERYRQPQDYSPRTGDYRLLFDCFSLPALAERLFLCFEHMRIQGHLLRSYPGLAKHLNSFQQHQLERLEVKADLLGMAECWLLGERIDALAANDPTWADLYQRLQQLAEKVDHSVYDSVGELCACYEQVYAQYSDSSDHEFSDANESLVDWLNREQRLEDWQEELEQIEEQLEAQGSTAPLMPEEDVEAVPGDASDGGIREPDLNITDAKEERDNLRRRVDMERSSIQHAIGPDRTEARSFRYDEWDYLNRQYLRAWCRVFEEPLNSGDSEPSEAQLETVARLKNVIRDYQPTVQRQLEQIRPAGLERVRRVQDGDELDLNAVIEARQDIRAGQSPDERVYSRKERVHRDVCAAFLVDLSASTDDPIKVPEPRDWSDYDPDKEVDLRAGWYSGLDLEEEEHDEPERKIIDLEQEAMVVMAAALDALGDHYGVYGFSGYGKDCVEVFVAKDIEEGFSRQTLHSIAAMRPRGSTRMGPAIRHSSQKLMASGHAMKVLIVISDGFPQDSDYGPERGNHSYGVEDTARALLEAQQKGVETFCITVDKSGHDYLKKMCPDARYLVLDEIEDLPEQLTKVYTALTGR